MFPLGIHQTYQIDKGCIRFDKVRDLYYFYSQMVLNLFLVCLCKYVGIYVAEYG